MKKLKELPFEEARRVTAHEVESARKAITSKLGVKRPIRRGRPPKPTHSKFIPISIRLHPEALAWLKRESARLSIPYQTIINQLLLKEAA